METIRKKICLDDYRSHINGIFPYIFYYDNNCSIQIDNELNNYGDFVCDIVKYITKAEYDRNSDYKKYANIFKVIYEKDEITGKYVIKGYIIVLRYLEALRKYHQVSEIIRNALFNPQCHEGCEWTGGTTFLKENTCEKFYDCNVVTYDESESVFTESLGKKIDDNGTFVTKSWNGSGKTTYGYDYIGEPTTPIKQYVYYAKDSGVWPQCLYGRYIDGTNVVEKYNKTYVFENEYVPYDYTAAVSGWFYTDKEETEIFDGNIRRGGPSGEIITNIYTSKHPILTTDVELQAYINAGYVGYMTNVFVPSDKVGYTEARWKSSYVTSSNPGLTHGGNVVLPDLLFNITQDNNAKYYSINYDGTLADIRGFSSAEYDASRWETYYDALTSETTEVCGGDLSVNEFKIKYGYTNIQMVVSDEEKALLTSIEKWWKTFWGQHLLKNVNITDDAIRFWLEFKEFFIKSENGSTLFRILNTGKPQIYFDSNDNYWNTEEVVNTFDMVSPYIEIPICLNQTKADGGLYTTYEYDLADDGNIVKSNNATDLSVTTEFKILNIPVSSQLFNLISPDAIVYKDVDGNDVIGIPQPLGVEEEEEDEEDDDTRNIKNLKNKNGKGKIYKCDYKSGTTLESGAFNVKQIGETYYYWTAIESGESITRRLSEPDVNNSNGYVEVQYVTSIPSILGIDNLEPGSYIYVKSKFDKELEIPYEETNLYDLESGKTYNIIKKITESDGRYLIDYAINVDGGNTGHTGFYYRDVIKYKKEGKTLLVNDIYETELSVYTLTMESSTLLSGETTNVKEDSNLPILFFNPSMDGLVDPPEVKVDFSLDRGSSAAWERHFKLMECNTMEDLENYGNNYFNARQ